MGDFSPAHNTRKVKKGSQPTGWLTPSEVREREGLSPFPVVNNRCHGIQNGIRLPIKHAAKFLFQSGCLLLALAFYFFIKPGHVRVKRQTVGIHQLCMYLLLGHLGLFLLKQYGNEVANG